MSERSGIEIDYCPQCRGVWLDRGELDKIIERSMSQPQAPQYEQPQQYGQQPYAPPRYDDDDDYRRSPKRRRESWLSDLFD